MGRGPTVAAQKDKNAKTKAKVFTIHAKLIALAAEKGADIGLNNALADAIHTAKKDGVTADVIDRAVKRGAGLDKEFKKIEEIFYEGYGPGGTAIIIRTLTDNRNRTASNIRHIFSAFGGNMGETGSVSNFAFDYSGLITIEMPTDMDTFEMMILDTDAQDYREETGNIIIHTDKHSFLSVKENLEKKQYKILSSTLGYIAKNYTQVTDFENALKIYKMLEEFDSDEDTENVWNTADISDTLWDEVVQFVESKKFRT